MKKKNSSNIRFHNRRVEYMYRVARLSDIFSVFHYEFIINVKTRVQLYTHWINQSHSNSCSKVIIIYNTLNKVSLKYNIQDIPVTYSWFHHTAEVTTSKHLTKQQDFIIEWYNLADGCN